MTIMCIGTSPDCLQGFQLLDGLTDLGDLEEVVRFESRTYYVLDSRHWTFGAKRLIPANGVTQADLRGRTATSRYPRQLIRTGPDFDPFNLTNRDYWCTVHRHYEADPEL